jgi:hypothetical protein
MYKKPKTKEATIFYPFPLPAGALGNTLSWQQRAIFIYAMKKDLSLP